MSRIASQPLLTRRALLKQLGILGSALAATTSFPLATRILNPSADAASLSAPTLKIGFLLPSSHAYPELAASLMSGARLRLAEQGNILGGQQVELVVEEIGYGAGSALVKARMLLEGGAKLLVGMLGINSAPALYDLLDEHGALLLLTEAGANLPRSSELHPHVFYNTLAGWQSAWVAGQWAARHVGRRAMLAASFYDSGYDAPFAFQQGFEAAGGQVVATTVTHVPPRLGGLAELLEQVRGHRPDLIYAHYSGQPAADFLAAYAASGLQRVTPLLASPFLFQSAQGASSNSVQLTSAMPWTPELSHAANRNFVDQHMAYLGDLPDAFTVLGYDSVALLVRALEAVEGNFNEREQLRAVLLGATLTSPRGYLSMDAQSQQLTGPLYLHRVAREGIYLQSESIVQAAAPIAAMHVAMASNDLRTGWLNPYLCV